MRMACLSDVVEIRKSSYGNELGKEEAAAFVAKVSNISDQGEFHNEFEERSFSRRDLQQLIVQVGDLCVVKSSGSKAKILSGKTAIVGENTISPLVASNFCFLLRPNTSLVEPRYLWRILNSPSSKAFIKTVVAAFTYPNLNWSTYSKFCFPLPALPVQKRIAAILDAADALRAKRRESIEQLDSLIQSTFLEMFGDPRRENSIGRLETQPMPLGNVTKIRTGKLDANAADEDGSYPFFTCAATPLKINAAAYDCKAVLVAGNGDLNVKYYEGKFNAYQRTYVIESSDETILNPRFLYAFLDLYVSELRKMAIGGVIKYIKLPYLKDAVLQVPSHEHQTRFASIVESIEQQKARLKAHLAELDTLFASLQSRAFNGELVA